MRRPLLSETIIILAGAAFFLTAAFLSDSGYAIAGAILWATAARIECARVLAVHR